MIGVWPRSGGGGTSFWLDKGGLGWNPGGVPPFVADLVPLLTGSSLQTVQPYIIIGGGRGGVAPLFEYV